MGDEDGEGESARSSASSSRRAVLSIGVGLVDFRMPFSGRFVEDADDRRVDREADRVVGVSENGVCGSSSQSVVVDGRDDDGRRGDFGDVDSGRFSFSGDSDLSQSRDVDALDGGCGAM